MESKTRTGIEIMRDCKAFMAALLEHDLTQWPRAETLHHELVEYLRKVDGKGSNVVTVQERYDRLGVDERAVIDAVLDGLERGRDVYGELVLSRERRHLVSEATEELRDAVIYLAAAALKQRGER